MINEINVEREKSDRLTVAKLSAVKQFNKQDYKSKLMTEKYSLLPLNPQQLTPVQTAIQRMSEKHLDFEIEPINTIQHPWIEFTQTPQMLVPIDTPLSIIRKHIPRQSYIDKIVKNILLVIPEKYEPTIFNMYHDSLLAGHPGPYHTAMTIRQKFFIHNLMNKVKRYIKACHTCLKTKPKYMKN